MRTKRLRCLLGRIPATALFCVLLTTTLAAAVVRANDEASHAFASKCASCHGADGQGVQGEYEKPLAGATTLDDLVKIVEETMPEEAPEECVGEEARAIAEYMFGRFYRESQPPRSELVRLTVPQYRNAVADVLAKFAPQPSPKKTPTQQAGLEGQYFQS